MLPWKRNPSDCSSALSASYRSVYWRIWSAPAIEPQLDIAPIRKYTVARRSGQQAMNSLRASFAPLGVDPAYAVPTVGAGVGSTDRKTAAVGADPGGHPYRAPDSPVLPGAEADPPKDRASDGAGLRGQGGLRPAVDARTAETLAAMWPCAGSAAWELQVRGPSESVFSRAFAEFADTHLPQRVHEALIRETHHDRLVGHLSRDSTAIEAS